MNNTRLQIQKLINVTDDTLCIYFHAPTGFSYVPGTYITLVLHINGRETRRPYSLSSCPGVDKHPFITVKLIENGEVTRYIHTQLKVGDEVEIMPPNGRFVLPQIIPGQLFFLAAGSGISPVFSLIKYALHHSSAKVFLVYSNRSVENAIFHDELNALEQLFSGRFSITWLFSSSKNLLMARLNRSLLEGFVSKHVSSLQKSASLFYTCGPFYYMEMIFITLITMGFKEEQLYKETFALPEEEEEDDGSLIEDQEAPEYMDALVKIKHNNTWFAIHVPKEQTILQAALKQGIKLPYSCKSGMCSTCTSQLTSGEVHMHYNQVLTDKEVLNGRMLTCTAHPLTAHITIETG